MAASSNIEEKEMICTISVCILEYTRKTRLFRAELFTIENLLS